jgi:voltage-gated sodium channel
MRNKIINLVETKWFQRLIIVVILLNALTIGLQTNPKMMGVDGMVLLSILDAIFLAIFTVELGLKLYAYKTSFFKSGWNNFDFFIVAVSYLPFIPGLSVLRSLRVLRVLRLISVIPQFRKVIQAFMDSLSGLIVIAAIMLIIFYVGAVMATNLFGATFPQWFGTIGRSLFSLFQIMTLESWSMGIVRPVMVVYPYAWAFFVPFILITTFSTLNLIIGVIVNSLQTLHNDTTNSIDEHLKKQDKESETLHEQLTELEKSIKELKQKL